MNPTGRQRFFDLLRAAIQQGALVKLTLAKPRHADPTLKNILVRPITLKAGAHLAFTWRHDTRDVTKNLSCAAGLQEIERLLGTEFLDAHLFTATQHAQLETADDGRARVKIMAATTPAPSDVSGHDRAKAYPIPADAPWLHAIGVTNDRGRPREGMSDKFRQIQKFAELLAQLTDETFADRSAPGSTPWRIADMGSGKGYLTFAVAAVLGSRAVVHGVEARPALVDFCNQVAREQGFADRLSFSAGTIAETPVGALDVLIALHACDTATDDALARGLASGARLLVVSPCCQKELRRQLRAPAVMADAFRHGIFQERHAEFATDALRAQLLEWAGFRTKVFEFIATEHTARNLMIAAIKLDRPPADAARAALAERIQAFADFYGIRHHRLADHLGFALTPIAALVPEERP